jgi:20S proteasome subunit alpha 7
VEYAKKAVDNSSTAIGIKGKDGVVLGVEKLIMSKLHEPSSNRRIMNIDRHVGMTMAGLLTDARQVATSAREESSDYRAVFGGPIPLRVGNILLSACLCLSVCVSLSFSVYVCPC